MRPSIVQFELDNLPNEQFKNLHEYAIALEKRLMIAEIKEWCAQAPNDWLKEAEQHFLPEKARKLRFRESRIDDIVSIAATSWDNANAMHVWIQRFHGA